MYTDYYGLDAAPFQLTPDARFWFESSTHKKAMAYLSYGLAQNEGFIVVTGDIGAGKTTLVGHLMASIDPARLQAFTIVSTQVAGDDMLRLVAHAFGIETDGVAKAQLLARIERYLQETGRSGRRTLLIVDEAQNLPIESLEELRMLSNFQAAGSSLLQIFLLGQPEFRDRLNTSPALEQMRQRVIATHHLDPMSIDETLPYLEHRLRRVGWTGRPQITPGAAAALHTASEGLPRKLNTIATRVLLMGSIEGTAVVDDALVARVLSDLAGETPARPADVGAADRPSAPIGEAVPFDYTTRIALIEAQLHEQEAALRRVLTLLVDWVERDDTALRASAA